MKLASYIDRNSAHEVLYKAVSRDGAVYRGVLVRPNILVSLNDKDPDIVASTEDEAVERLLWIMLNPEDETPEGFVEAKCGDDGSRIRGFFYDEYDEFDESEPAEKKFHGLLSSGSDISLDAASVWVRPWEEEEEEEEEAKRGPVYKVSYVHDRYYNKETEERFYTADADNGVFRELSPGRAILLMSVCKVDRIAKVPLIGDIVDTDDRMSLIQEGYTIADLSRGVYVVTEVPPEVQEALRWL